MTKSWRGREKKKERKRVIIDVSISHWRRVSLCNNDPHVALLINEYYTLSGKYYFFFFVLSYLGYTSV